MTESLVSQSRELRPFSVSMTCLGTDDMQSIMEPTLPDMLPWTPSYVPPRTPLIVPYVDD